jgi:hypothetical protein
MRFFVYFSSRYLSNTMAEMVEVNEDLVQQLSLKDQDILQVQRYLQQLTLDRCRIDILSPWDQRAQRPSNVEIEPFYGTEYVREPLSPSLIAVKSQKSYSPF